MNSTNSTSASYDIYGYSVNLPLAGVAGALFVILSMILCIETVLKRRWYMFTVVVGSFTEAIGYFVRIPSGQNPDSLGPAIPSILCILLAPIVIALGTYLTVSDIAKKMKKGASLLPPKVIEWAFVIVDIVSFLIQAMGGSLLTIRSSSAHTLAKVLLSIGLSLALASFSVFLLVTVVLQVRTKEKTGEKWRILFLAAYVNIACLIIRSTYRLVEYLLGVHNFVVDHEAFFYCLDTLPMLVAVSTWIILHPGFYTISAANKAEPGGL